MTEFETKEVTEPSKDTFKIRTLLGQELYEVPDSMLGSLGISHGCDVCSLASYAKNIPPHLQEKLYLHCPIARCGGTTFILKNLWDEGKVELREFP